MIACHTHINEVKQWAEESIAQCKKEKEENLRCSLDLYTWYYLKGKEDAYEEFLVKLDFTK